MFKKLFLLLFILLSLGSPAYSIITEWEVAALNGNWSDGGNWNNGVPTVGDDAVFSRDTDPQTYIIDLNGVNAFAQSLTFNVGSFNNMDTYTIQNTGAPAALNTGSIFANDQPDLQSYTTTISADLSLTATTQLGSALNNLLVISGVISGGSSPDIQGRVTFSGANSYTGDTLLNGGILSISSNDNLGNVNSEINVNQSSTLTTTTGFTIPNTRAIAIGAGFTGTIETQGGGNTTTIQASITGEGILQKTGDGVLTLASFDNSYRGGTIVNGGTLSISDNGNLGQFGDTLSFTGDSKLQITSAFTFDRPIVISEGVVGTVENTDVAEPTTISSVISHGGGGGTSSFTKDGSGELVLTNTNTYTGTTSILSGTLTISTLDNIRDSSDISLTPGVNPTLKTTSGITINKPVSLNGGTGRIEVVGEATTTSITGDVTGAGGSLQKTGSGTLVLSSTNNSYDGGTIISAGTLSISSNNNLGHVDGDITISATSTLKMTGSPITLPNTRAIAISAGVGVFDIDEEATGSLIEGDISGAGGFDKAGAGALTLSGTNTYQLGTGISAGTLIVSADANLGQLGVGFDDINFSGTSTLQVTSAFTTTRGADIVNGVTAVINVPDLGGDSFQVDGVVAGQGALQKAGAGELILNGANEYLGGTSLSGGKLSIATDNNLGDVNGDIAFVGNSTLEINGNITLPNTRNISISAGVTGTFEMVGGSTSAVGGVISGGGALAATGGFFSLTGNNTYQGGTQIGSVEFTVTNDANLGNVNGGISFTDSGNLHLPAGFDLPATRTITVNTANTPAITCDNGGGVVVIRGPINAGDGLTTRIQFETPFAEANRATFQFTNNFSSSLGFTVSDSILSLSSTGSLPGTESMSFFSSGVVVPQLHTSVDITTSRPLSLNSSASTEINPDANTTLTLNGQILDVASARSLTKIGDGTLVLGSATSNYSGGTIISAGVVSVSDNGNLGADTGGVTFTGNSTLTSTSGFTLSSGRAITINPEVTATFRTEDTTTATTIAGVISGTGQLKKTGTGELILSGENKYTGATTISGGTLTVTGSLATDGGVSITSAGTLKGTGTVGAVTNVSGGVTAPGASIGTLNIVGDYNQGPTSTLEIEINAAGESDLLAITGTANLDGTVLLLPEAGLYTFGQTFRFLTAANINGAFSSLVESHPGAFELVYGATFIDIQVLASFGVLPFTIDSFLGNTRRVAEYVFGDNFVPNDSDLLTSLNTLLALPTTYQDIAIIKLSPLIYGALPVANLQNDIRMSHLMRKQYRGLQNERIDRLRERRFRYSRALRRQKIREDSYTTFKQSSLWAEPIFFVYNQDNVCGKIIDEGQPAFTAYTYGSGLGWNHFFDDYFVMNIGAGYTHSSIAWERGLGSGFFNTAYLAPSVGWVSDKLSAYVLFQASVYFYNMEREIHYGYLKRKATNRHNSYDFLQQVGVSYRLKRPGGSFIVQPEIEFNCLEILQDAYKEGGAGGLNLEVRRNTAVILQPNCNLNFIKEMYTKHVFIAPTIYVGWLMNAPLSNGKVRANFIVEQTNRPVMEVIGYTKVMNQITLGFDVPVQNYKGLAFNVGYQANFLGQFQIYQATAKINWDF